MSQNQDITALRTALFATLESLRNGTMELDKARAINEVAKTITETAKVEVQYLQATGGGESAFLDSTVGAGNLPNGITQITRHRLVG